MKTLTDHTIVYDEECPLCQAYTNAFIKTGMLDSQGREPYHKMVGQEVPNIDWTRARNEIALINKKDHSISYGNDSLLCIISFNWPVVQRIFKFKPFRFLLDRFYFLISFNRKVIAPGKVFEGRDQCTPDFNAAYRWTYILFAWIVFSLMLMSYSSLLIPCLPASSFIREFLVCGGQVVFQGIIVYFLYRERCLHYLGNMMTVSLMGSILLFPAFLFARFTNNNLFFIGYFLLVVGLMFFDHLRRVKILGLCPLVSFTWLGYWLLVIGFGILPTSLTPWTHWNQVGELFLPYVPMGSRYFI